jgi:hypothetical protein
MLIRTLFAAALLCCATLASAATLIAHYDVNNPLSWDGAQLKSLTGIGNALTPGAGNPRNQSGPDTTPDDFGAPVYRSSGAMTSVTPPPFKEARDRAWLDFEKFGVLGNSNVDQSSFNTGLPDNANIGGYTLEGYFLLRTGYAATENSGVGFSQSTSGENQLLRINRGIQPGVRSNSAVDNAAGNDQGYEQMDQLITSIIPLDQWFHFVKVHDPVLDQIRYYINGVYQPSMTISIDPDNSGVEYHKVGVNYGNVGVPGREVRNVGYSMTRFYAGVLTDAEIYANFLEVAFIPEPGAIAAISLAGAMLLRRRR